MALDASANQEQIMMQHFSTVAQIGVAIPVGMLCGAAYFISLHRAVRLIAAGQFAKTALIQCLRFGLLAMVFFGLAKMGAAALLSGALGLLLARQIVLHRVRNAP
jgi:hypothetical protein